jgi:putative ABC transport system substrate-binding protein
MDRRAFVAVVAGGFLVAANIARPQPIRKVATVGILHSSPAATFSSSGITAIRNGLRDLGYVEGQNIVLEFRSATGGPEQLPGYAAELVRLNADVIVAIGPPAVRAAKDATSVLPIVAMDLETDPVASGFARSLERPEGNITGLFMDTELVGKWLELLRAVVPEIQNVGVLWDSGTGPAQLAAVKAAAQGIAVKLQVLEIRNAVDLDATLGAGLNGDAKALMMLSSPVVGSTVNSKRIAVFAASNRLPAISPFRSFTEAGGLMSYGPSILDVYRSTSTFVDKILKGATPGDLPIERPNKSELVINMKTAKALGLTIPQTLLLRADEVIP